MWNVSPTYEEWIMVSRHNYNKYGAKKTLVGDQRFDSQAEAKRYTELKLLERANEIKGLNKQVPFTLKVGTKVIGKYLADFVYKRGDKVVVEDVKGFKTPLYRWKAKHFEAQFGYAITEIKAR